MLDIRNINGLVDSTPNCEELSFSGSDINHIVDRFGDWPVVWVDVQYWSSNIISYTSVWNNNQGVEIVRSINSDVVEITYMIFDIMSSDMEGEPIWVEIYKSLSWRKLFIKRRKNKEDFITLIVHIN